MKRKFGYKISMMDVFLLVVGFALAFFDMSILQGGIAAILGSNGSGVQTNSAMMAVIVATIANTFAFDWGRRNGMNLSKRAVNSKSLFSFLVWVAFGIGYALIEVAKALNSDSSNADIISLPQIGEYILLTLSYISSGIAIQKGAAEIFDADAVACRAAEAEYKRLSRQVGYEESQINYLLMTLENYDQNYEALDEQYAKQKEAIDKAELSVLAGIKGKFLNANPEIMPSDADAIVEQARDKFLDDKRKRTRA